MGCFRVEPRAEILHQKRQSIPLPPPINRFYLHAPEVEKFGSKDNQKPASLPHFLLPTKLFLLSPPRRSATSLNTSISITSDRPNTSYSERADEPLASVTFLLPSPATDTGHRSLHRSLLTHQPNLLVAAKLPPRSASFPFPFFFFHCYAWTVECELIHSPLFTCYVNRGEWINSLSTIHMNNEE